jgi:hypothetical protein
MYACSVAIPLPDFVPRVPHSTFGIPHLGSAAARGVPGPGHRLRDHLVDRPIQDHDPERLDQLVGILLDVHAALLKLAIGQSGNQA